MRIQFEDIRRDDVLSTVIFKWVHAETFFAASLDSTSRMSQRFVLLARMAQIIARSSWRVGRAIAASLLVLAVCAALLPAAAAPEATKYR
jgi:hypothetical protein